MMLIDTRIRKIVGADLLRPISDKFTYVAGRRPTPGRPQGSPLRTTQLPPLQRPVATLHPSRRLCKGGSGGDEWMGPLRSPWGGVMVT